MAKPAVIRFNRGGSGEFGFDAVTAQLDCRYNKAGVIFTWLGQDEMDDVSGCGHAEQMPDGTLAGHLHTHPGDNSGSMTLKE